MPRGRGKSYKGRSRNFTSADELERQSKDIKNWRRKPDDEEDDDDEEKKEDEDEEEIKRTGISALIEVENPNHIAQKAHKVDVLETESAKKPELSRREREAIEKEQAKIRYQKLQAEGKTDEARADLARLAIVKKQREEAAKKKEEEKLAKEKQMSEASQAARVSQETRALAAGSQKAARKKKK